MKTIAIKYVVEHSYNAGLLSTDYKCNSFLKAKIFVEDYKNNFNDCEKSYRIYKITSIKVCGIVIRTKVETIADEYIED